MSNKTTNFQIYTAIQSLEDLIKSQYVEHQKRFDDQDQLLKNFEEEVKLQLADQQNKIEELITIVQQKGFDGSDNNNNRQLIDMINAELVSLNDHNGLISDKLDTFETLLEIIIPTESIQGEELINNTRHSYHKTHPTLVRYLHCKIKLHRKKKLAYDNKTLPANQMVGEEYLPDISNTPTAGNNPIVIERYVDYFIKDWEVRKNTNVITDIAVQYFHHLHKDYLALKKNPDTFNNRNVKQRRDNRLTLDQCSDTKDLRHPKEEIKLILHKRCISLELTDEEHQELHPQDKKQLLVAPIYWRSDERVYPESDHSQYDELIGLSPDKLSFLPDWA
ncbi:9659_t:CDS:2 [Racocetra fulgida]|uniref:9659_t:CDS:1 n=1 Tax=Racocetra fulgida TaxID=60492 RepID=A0A9N9AYF8_9GLOM|nr:9659_t:CDS:2 [Racocetra fulgida]